MTSPLARTGWLLVTGCSLLGLACGGSAATTASHESKSSRPTPHAEVAAPRRTTTARPRVEAPSFTHLGNPHVRHAAVPANRSVSAGGPEISDLGGRASTSNVVDAHLRGLLEQAVWCYDTGRFAGARQIWEDIRERVIESGGEEHYLARQAKAWLKHLERVDALQGQEVEEFQRLRAMGAEVKRLCAERRFGEASRKAQERAAICCTLFGRRDPQYYLCLKGVAECFRLAGGLTEARQWSKEALKVLEQLGARSDPAYAQTLHDLAETLCGLGELDEAAECLVEAQRLVSAAEGEQSDDAVRVLESLIAVRCAVEEYDDARKVCQYALQVINQKGEVALWDRFLIIVRIAWIDAHCGLYEQALRQLHTVLPMAETLPPDTPRNAKIAATGYMTLAYTQMCLGHLRRAAQNLDDALRLALHSGHPSPLSAQCQLYLAQVHLAMGQPAKAETAATEALGQIAATLGADGPIAARAHELMGTIRMEKGDYTAASRHLRKALLTIEEVHPVPKSLRASILDHLGYAYLCAGEIDRAGPLLREALELRNKRLPAGHLELNRSRFHLAVLHMAQGKFDQAEAMLAEVLRRYEQSIGTNNPDYLHALDAYVELLRRQGKRDEAQKIEQRLSPILEYLKQQGCHVENLYPKPWPPTVSLPSSTDDM